MRLLATSSPVYVRNYLKLLSITLIHFVFNDMELRSCGGQQKTQERTTEKQLAKNC